MSTWAERIQTLGLYLTALSVFSAPAGVSVGLALLWLGFLLSLAGRDRPPVTPSLWIGLAFGVHVVVSTLASPGLAQDPAGRLASAADWLQLCVFIPVAYALRGNQRRLLQLLVLALVGLALGVLWRLDWALLWSDPGQFGTSRPGFGFPTIIFALFSGTALIGLFVLRRRWWGLGTGGRGQWWILLWIFSTAAVAQTFILTLARGAALALAASFVIGLRIYRLDPKPAAVARPRRSMIVAAAVLALGLLALNARPIAERLWQEWGAVGAMLSGQIDYSPESSVSLRWNAQRFGFDAWLARPWLGWGPGSSNALIAASGDQTLATDNDGPLVHLHDTYLEILVQLGLIGLVLWVAILASLIAAVRTGRRSLLLSQDVARFLILSILYLVIWSLFDFHAVHQGWRGFWALLAGAALSFGLFDRDGAGDRTRSV